MEPATGPEQGKLRVREREREPTAFSLLFFSVLAVLIVVGVVWGLNQSFSLSAPGINPNLPTLPGETPEPRKP